MTNASLAFVLFHSYLRLANFLVSAGANLFIQSTVLIVLGLALYHFLHRRGPAVGSLILRGVLVALILSPFLSLTLSRMGLSIVSLPLPRAGWRVTEQPGIVEETRAGASEDMSVPTAADGLNKEAATPAQIVPLLPLASKIEREPKLAVREGSEASVPATISAGMTRLTWAYFIFSGLWIAGASGLFGWLAICHILVAKLRHLARPAPEGSLRTCQSLARQMRVKCPQVLISREVKSPLLTGLFSPVIILPASPAATGGLYGSAGGPDVQKTEDTVASEAVFIHELAHLKRRDCFWNLIARVLTSLLFYQPFMWLLARKAEEASDDVCDDYVIRYGCARKTYARQLTYLAERFQPSLNEATVGAGVVRFRSSLGRRVVRILDASRRLTTAAPRPAVFFTALGVLICALLAGTLGFLPRSPAETMTATQVEMASLGETPFSLQTKEPLKAGETRTAAEAEQVEAEHISPHGYALSFDGADDFLEVPDSEILDVGDEFTVEVWLKVGEAVGERAILSKEVPWKSGYTLIVEGMEGKDGFCNLTFGVGDGTRFRNLKVPGILKKGKWAHVTAVWDKGQVSLMLNGEIVGRSILPKPAPARVPLMIGKGSADLGRHTSGEIGEIRIWNVARSQSQIRSYRMQTLTGKEAGLVACWTFNEGSGQVAHDISANGNHARLGSSSDADDADPKWSPSVQEQTPGQAMEKGPEWVVLDSPVAGTKYALQFDGLADFVEVPDSPSLDLTNSLTLEAWINFDVGGDNNPRIISKGWEVRTGYELAVYGTGEKRRLAFLAKEIGRTYSNTILRAHTWYHVAATYNGTEVTLYVNGKQDILRNVTGSDVPFHIPTNNISLNIGRNSQNFTDRYKGLIKEARVWSVARREDEIRRDMSRVLTGTEAHLAAYWKFDEGKGLTVHDISPHKNHGYRGDNAAQELPRIREAKEEVPFDLLTAMVSVGRCVMKQEADYVALTPSTPDRSYMRTKEAFCPPFVLQIRGMTDSTNLRLYYGSGMVIFNWELRPTELRVHDPLTGRVTRVRGQGYISPNRWHDITWEIEPDGMRVLVDGEERFRRTGDYSKIEEPVGIGPAFGSKLSVQSFVIRRGVNIEQVRPKSAPGEAVESAAALADHQRYAWQRTDRYVPPDSEAFFPDDPDGGRKLDALFDAIDKDLRPDEEILSTVRRGFLRTKEYRTLILAWIGNRYIWGKRPQNPEGIEIMYHAVPIERHYAVYFGLSVVRPKSYNILRTLTELAISDHEPNTYGRIVWGLKGLTSEERTVMERILAEQLDRCKSDPHDAAALYYFSYDIKMERPPSPELERAAALYPDDAFQVSFTPKEPFQPESVEALWEEFLSRLPDGIEAQRVRIEEKEGRFLMVARLTGVATPEAAQEIIRPSARLRFSPVTPLTPQMQLFLEERAQAGSNRRRLRRLKDSPSAG